MNKLAEKYGYLLLPVYLIAISYLASYMLWEYFRG